MKYKILVTPPNYSRLCPFAKKRLEDNGCEVVENTFGRPITTAELKERVGDIDGAIIGVDVWNEEIFSLAPKLKVMSRFGVGVDNFDIPAAHKRGIVATNAPGCNSNAVAEQTIGLIIAAMRAIPQLQVTTRQGAWDRFVGHEIVGRTVGLMGFGNIARKVARKLSGFEVAIVAFDKYPNLAAAAELGVAMVTADEVLSRSDVVCMLLPSLPETRHFMNRETFARMKDGAYFVNTARGALVDEAALAEAVRSGKLTAAGVDVYEVEPTSANNPLFQIDRLVTTPHTAAETFETYTAVGEVTATAVLDVLAGRQPSNRL
jgi:D-3-phosphoglycerate dehydrogenase / 2-oxoglutarate reductase